MLLDGIRRIELAVQGRHDEVLRRLVDRSANAGQRRDGIEDRGVGELDVGLEFGCIALNSRSRSPVYRLELAGTGPGDCCVRSSRQ